MIFVHPTKNRLVSNIFTFTSRNDSIWRFIFRWVEHIRMTVRDVFQQKNAHEGVWTCDQNWWKNKTTMTRVVNSRGDMETSKKKGSEEVWGGFNPDKLRLFGSFTRNLKNTPFAPPKKNYQKPVWLAEIFERFPGEMFAPRWEKVPFLEQILHFLVCHNHGSVFFWEVPRPKLRCPQERDRFKMTFHLPTINFWRICYFSGG